MWISTPALRERYKKIERVDVAHRTAIVVGGRLPDGWRARIRPVPAAVIRIPRLCRSRM
ncbi:MAG: hypothetical protein ABSF64_22340 [Bryobacteraceae bacterium]